MTTPTALTASCLIATLATSAAARELSASDLRTIATINSTVNHDASLMRISARDPSCGAYAVNKLYLLMTHGFGKDPVSLGLVMIPGGQLHAVAEITDDNTTYVLDSLSPYVETRKTLEGRGYVWIGEFER